MLCNLRVFFFLKQKTAYEMRISDLSSDVCSSDLLARPGEGFECHVIHCSSLADGIDADWIDLRWQEDSEGGNARLCVVILNEPGTLAEMSVILASTSANITNLRLSNREGDFHTYDIVVEVRDVHHVMRILSARARADQESGREACRGRRG